MKKKPTEKEFIAHIRKTFADLALQCPFTYPLVSFKIILNPKQTVIMGTNSRDIIVNPQMWAAATKEQRLCASLDCFLHIGLFHPKRVIGKDPIVFGYAASFVNHGMINDDFSHFKMPPGDHFVDQYLNYKPVEEVYKDLASELKTRRDANHVPVCTHCRTTMTPQAYIEAEKAPPEARRCDLCTLPIDDKNYRPFDRPLTKEDALNLMQCGITKGRDETVQPMPGDVDQQKLQDELVKALARHKASQPGNLPGMYEAAIEQMKKNKIPWHRILARMGKTCLKSKADRNPFKPEPKYLPYDVFIPTDDTKGTSTMVIVVDTSGSMADFEFEYALGHIKKICAAVDKLTVITSDTIVQECVRIRNLKSIIQDKQIKFKGRGGTDMTAAFEKANSLNPQLILLITDMEFAFPPKPRAPVIFLHSNDRCKDIKSPYGYVIYVDRANDEASFNA